MAAAGAAGAAGLRLLTMQLSGGSAHLTSAAGPAGAWTSPLDQPRALAAHLLRRGGLGHTGAELDAAASLGYDDLVERLLAQAPEPLTPPADQTNHAAVVQSWYAHMATTKAPFPERMTLFWHGVLTSDYRKSNQLPLVIGQNRLYRDRGRGDLRTLLSAVTMDPLMMRYLDLERSNAKAPNENYSRELMELFTLGVGNYSETDVREGARALTGFADRRLRPRQPDDSHARPQGDVATGISRPAQSAGRVGCHLPRRPRRATARHRQQDFSRADRRPRHDGCH